MKRFQPRFFCETFFKYFFCHTVPPYRTCPCFAFFSLIWPRRRQRHFFDLEKTEAIIFFEKNKFVFQRLITPTRLSPNSLPTSPQTSPSDHPPPQGQRHRTAQTTPGRRVSCLPPQTPPSPSPSRTSSMRILGARCPWQALAPGVLIKDMGPKQQQLQRLPFSAPSLRLCSRTAK